MPDIELYLISALAAAYSMPHMEFEKWQTITIILMESTQRIRKTLICSGVPVSSQRSSLHIAARVATMRTGTSQPYIAEVRITNFSVLEAEIVSVQITIESSSWLSRCPN